MVVPGTHDSTLVALSILIATAASYTALDLAGRIRASSGAAKFAWTATAAVAMGGGIWSMHFVAMLAFTMPMQLGYDPALTTISLVIPIFVTGIGFRVVCREGAAVTALAASGLFMGLGIAGMHYTGMAAMRMAADLSYDSLLVAVSVLIAIGASTVALWLAFRNTGVVQKLVAAVAMGLAVSGMHYTAMEAATFTAASAVDHAQGHASLDQSRLAIAVSATTFLILFLALIAAMFDRRFAVLAEREAVALRESEKRFRNLYRRTPLPLHALNAEGVLEQVSDAWLELTGYARDEVVGRPLTDFMMDESSQRRLAEDWPKLLRDGELRDAEYRLVSKGGEVLDCLLSARVERDENGNFVRTLSGLIDVTAHKRAEAALHQAQKIEAMGQLTGGVAHDFNNLLAIVLGSLELLRKRLPDDPKIRGLVDNALEGAKRGATLTRRMLAFARRQDLRPGAVDVPQLVRGMADLLQRSLGPMIRIETRFPIRLAPAHVDANQLELALLNLAVNARDAMPGGGTLTISADEESVPAGHASGLLPGRYIRLVVSDAGEGMDADTLSRATEPFFTTKGVGKGTGLGLSMAHGLAAQSGGQLTIESCPGEGTSVAMRLPVAAAATAAGPETGRQKPPLAAPSETNRSLSVLIVDDDALVLEGTAAMLEDLGHTAVQALSAEQALNVLRAGRPVHLVITDHAMPGMTGAELRTAIRAQWPGLPVILATGYAELPRTEDPAPQLSKPFDLSTLARVIEEVAERVIDAKVVPLRAKQS